MSGNQPAREQLSPEVRNAMAGGWMKRGIALLNENTPVSLTASLVWFEGAIELRRALPLDGNPWHRYLLAGGWMNRGDALTRLGSTENLAEAVGSYDHALVLLRTLDLKSNPLFRKRLALAWMNRGITLQEQGTPVSLRAAVESFEEAIAGAGPQNWPVLACALMNRGNVLLRLTLPEPVRARESVEQALALVADAEDQELLAAEIGLKAWLVLCRAIASQLADGAGPMAPEDLVAAATDAVDDGMKLARQWEARGERRFRDLAVELFRFGARAYQMHQSHFLSEFLLENFEPGQARAEFPADPEMHAAAGEAIARARAEIQHDGFRSLNTPRFDRFLETLRQLRIAQMRLDELRQACPVAAAPLS